MNSGSNSQYFRKISSRSKTIFNLAVKSSDLNEEKEDNPESPLPPGADIEAINNLMEIFDESASSPTARDFEGINSAVQHVYADTIINTFVQSSDESIPDSYTARPIQERYIPASESDVSFNEDRTLNTPCPSIKCEINHLDNDCNNHFCPWFVPKQTEDIYDNIVSIESILLPESSFASTPQVNTPLSCSSANTTPVSNKRKPRKDKGNIRKKHVSEWIDVKRKALRNTGKEYKSRNGTTRPQKAMGPPCPQTCRMKCREKISELQRLNIFTSFWELGDRYMQWSYVANLISKQGKRRVYTDRPSNRKYTLKYKLPGPNFINVSYIDVCKKMFLSTFSVSEQFVYTSLNKIDTTTGVLTPDQRGKHTNRVVKITEDMKKSVCDHIKSLAPVESHYIRKKSTKLYLDSNLTFHRLFQLYNEWFDLTMYSTRATERQYRDLVNENFKLSLYVPKKDRCDQCHIFDNKDNPSLEEKEIHQAHLNNKNIARELKTTHKTEAKKSQGQIVTATFDFQKVLNAPSGDGVSILYYKRKLSVFNFTLFDLGLKEGTNYMWHEGQGKRGANEVASCLLEFVERKVENGCKDFRFFSDNCAGQNRNRIVYAFYSYISNKNKINITHTFLEKGHTQTEGDSVHALIERGSKNKIIYTPLEWYSLVRWVKQDGRPYIVKEMCYSDFFDFKQLLLGRNWSKNINGQKIEWNKIKQVHVKYDEPLKIYYKYDLSSNESFTLALNTNTRAKKKCNLISIPKLYNGPLPIPKAKKTDLDSLCKSGIIPKTYHDYFKRLPFTEERNDCSSSETDSD